MANGRVRWLLTIGVVVALYVAAAQLGLAVSYAHGRVSMIWFPAGLALAALVLGGRKLWPAIVIGEFIACMLHGTPPWVAVAFGCGNALEALAGRELLARARFDPRMTRVRDPLALLALAALGSTVIAATIGTTALMLGTPLTWSSFWATWHVWWLGDATGTMIVAPLIFAFALAQWRRPRGWRAVEGVGFVLAILMTVAAARVIAPAPEVTFVMLPLMIWGALRFEQRGATLVNAGVAVVGLMIAAHSTGFLAPIALTSRLLLVQDVCMITAVTSLVLAAFDSERTRALADLRASEGSATALANEKAALGRVATAVAQETPPAEMFELVSAESGQLFGLHEVLIVRDAGPDRWIVIGGWASDGDMPAAGSAIAAIGISAAINVHGVEWGRLCIPELTAAPSFSTGDFVNDSLPRFTRLLGLSIANSEGRQNLMNRASTDPLTGLANHRIFHERLAEELSRCRRYDRPISVALIDIDRFKAVNDAAGHLAGDNALATVAARISGVMRHDALVARLGGDEIAVLLPECDAETACAAIERARHAVSAHPIGGITVTASAGVCDNAHAHSADRILQLADGALYWAKAHGRDACVSYSPEVVRELSDTERADRLARSQALMALRALARAIDAKDSTTRGHSERVAEIAAALAHARGWDDDRVMMLEQAALVHDVGKLAVMADSVPANRDGGSEHKFEQMSYHAALSAQIASEILEPEQVQWIRWHHERPDGKGYPDALTNAEIPDGAKLLALANAWELLTSARTDRPAKPVREALQECIALAGTEFAPEAVSALLSAHEAGQLGPDAVPVIAGGGEAEQVAA